VKVAVVKEPLTIVHTGAGAIATMLPEIEQPVSVGLNPLPETDTPLPAGAMEGLREIVGEEVTTVKVAWAESPLGLAETVMTYGPGVAVLITAK
jgi:hypothetical protein